MALHMTGAQALVRALAAEQITLVFGIVGGKLAPVLHAISQQQGMRFVGVRHEAAAPMMAAAVQAASGQVAVALGEMGPGSLNLASGLGVAYNNHLPLLAITSNQHRAAAYPHNGMFMDLDTRALLAPITRWSAVVHDPRRIPELVRRAFREALGPRPGPVHLDIPQDVLSAACSFADDEFDLPPSRYRAVGGARPAAADIERAATLLRAARRPLIVAGGGVVASGAQGALRRLAALLQAPVVPTQMALGAVATDSPNWIGHGGIIAGDAVKSAFEQADTILSLGCRYSSWMWDEQGALARRDRHHININTDACALGLSVLHEIGLVADAHLTLQDLLLALGDQPVLAVQAGWLEQLRALRADYEARLAAMARDDGEPIMHPAALAQAVARALPSDALAVYDGGHTTFWSNDITPVHEVRTRFHESGMSHLGFGLPYALALQLQQPQRRVFNITGDGSFGFTLQELDTARRHGLPVVTIIHNNAAWGVIRIGQKKQFDFELGTGLEDTDYAAIARGFGCHGEVVTRADAVASALERALASGLPAVLDCRTRFVPHPSMPVFGSMNRYGFDALTRVGETQ
ncbi:thiamine pyrophosphate-binding protein [Hylemonella sp. W303a]|uniref:thiamine pyrophosphate-binding protein n=1 Tax=Hylemonella sp. W303a TaxID=3389873 RepID=UPI00396B1BAA